MCVEVDTLSILGRCQFECFPDVFVCQLFIIDHLFLVKLDLPSSQEKAPKIWVRLRSCQDPDMLIFGLQMKKTELPEMRVGGWWKLLALEDLWVSEKMGRACSCVEFVERSATLLECQIAECGLGFFYPLFLRLRRPAGRATSSWYWSLPVE